MKTFKGKECIHVTTIFVTLYIGYITIGNKNKNSLLILVELLTITV